MRVLDAHLFVMLDVSVGEPLQPIPVNTMSQLRSRAALSGGPFERLINQGSTWLFYGGDYVDEHGRPQPLQTMYANPRAAGPPHGDAPARESDGRSAIAGGVRLAVQPSLGLGVITIWTPLGGFGSEAPVVELRREAAQNQDALVEVVEAWGLDWDHVGRIMTLAAVRLDTHDLDDLVAVNARDVGALFTGNLEDEHPARLAAYARDENISGRRYERIYLRWSDALALYDQTTAEAVPACMRVARLAETGILTRRLEREVAFATEQVMRGIRPWTLPWLSRSTRQAEHLRQTLADVDLMVSVVPPTHSIEGEHLVARTLEAFEIPKLHANLRGALAELDRRLEWQRAKWLAGLAILAFLINAVISLLG